MALLWPAEFLLWLCLSDDDAADSTGPVGLQAGIAGAIFEAHAACIGILRLLHTGSTFCNLECMFCLYMHIYICMIFYVYAWMSIYVLHMYIHIYLRIHTCIHICIHTCIHTCIHAYIHTYIHTCIHACIHTYIHTYILTHLLAYIRTYVHICIYRYLHNTTRWYGVFVLTRNCREVLQRLLISTQWSPARRQVDASRQESGP